MARSAKPTRERTGALFTLLVCALVVSGASAQAAGAYGLGVSSSSDRSNAVALEGQTYAQSSGIYVFTQPATGASSVAFYLDDPTRSRSPRHVEGGAPYDFVTTASDGTAVRFALSSVSVGNHTITQAVKKTDGTTEVASATFTVSPANGPSANGALVFEDNFDGSTVNTAKWYQYVSAGHNGIGLRRASAFSVANGLLVITAKMVNGVVVTGGMAGRLNQTYGRYEFRVRTEKDSTGTTSGIVLTWPQRQFSPEFTENDMYETGTQPSRAYFNTFVHYGFGFSTQRVFQHKVDASQWHTVAMDWRASSLKLYRDGALVWNLTDKKVIPDVAHHVSVQLDARFKRNVSAPVHMYVDYVRIYK